VTTHAVHRDTNAATGVGAVREPPTCKLPHAIVVWSVSFQVRYVGVGTLVARRRYVP
jgi:hypothetical protein